MPEDGDSIFLFTEISSQKTSNMDNKGHIQMTDSGLAVGGLFEDMITTGMAGTREHIEPEVIHNDIYQFQPDWFSLWVVTYILDKRQMPFYSRTMDEHWVSRI